MGKVASRTLALSGTFALVVSVACTTTVTTPPWSTETPEGGPSTGSGSDASPGEQDSAQGGTQSDATATDGGALEDVGFFDGAAHGIDASTAVDSGEPIDAPANGFDQFQNENLMLINQYRAGGGLKPLTLDQQLCTFAAAGSLELSQDHMPHQHFINAGNNGTLWSSGFNTSAGKNQGDPNGWTKASSDPTTNELTQIQQILAAMYAEGPGDGEAHGHYENIMDPTFTRLGVGLLEVDSELYLTNDFSN